MGCKIKSCWPLVGWIIWPRRRRFRPEKSKFSQKRFWEANRFGRQVIQLGFTGPGRTCCNCRRQHYVCVRFWGRFVGIYSQNFCVTFSDTYVADQVVRYLKLNSAQFLCAELYHQHQLCVITASV
jgi:hypothetical protein